MKATMKVIGAVAFVFAAAFAQGQVTTTVNFDAINAYGTSYVGGATLADYLAGYGLTISHLGSGTSVVVMDERELYGGQAVDAPSNYNVLVQIGTATATSYRIEFATPVSNVTFERAGLIAGGSGVVHPAWNVSAYTSANQLLGSASDSLQGYFSNQPAVQYALAYENIAYLVVSGDAQSFAAFTNIVMDNLTFTTVPEPRTVALALGLLALAVVAISRRTAG